MFAFSYNFEVYNVYRITFCSVNQSDIFPSLPPRRIYLPSSCKFLSHYRGCKSSAVCSSVLVLPSHYITTMKMKHSTRLDGLCACLVREGARALDCCVGVLLPVSTIILAQKLFILTSPARQTNKGLNKQLPTSCQVHRQSCT